MKTYRKVKINEWDSSTVEIPVCNKCNAWLGLSYTEEDEVGYCRVFTDYEESNDRWKFCPECGSPL